MAEITERPKPVTATAKDIARRVFRYENAVLLIILGGLMGVMAILTKGKSATVSNLTHVLIHSSARGMAAIGQTFVILTAGIDLTPTGLSLMATCAGAQLMTRGGIFAVGKGPELPLYVGLLIMVLIGIGLGAVNGSLVSRVRVPPLIATLAMWQITKGLCLRITGGLMIKGLPEGLAFFGQGYVAGVPVPVIELFVATGLAYFVLNHTSVGKSVYAVGGNPVSAWLSGINVKNTLFWVYVISGFTSVLAGIILTARLMNASFFAISNLELDSIAAVVVGGVSLAGGRGGIIGVLIGVLILGVIRNSMNLLGLPAGLEMVATGAIIATAVGIDAWRRRGG